MNEDECISGQNLLETVSNGGSAPSPMSRSTALCPSIVMTVLVKCVTPIKINVFSFTKTQNKEIDKYYFVPQIFAFNFIARAGDGGDVCRETGPAGRLFVF